MAQLTHQEFSDEDLIFQEACKLAGLMPSRRQASKYRRAMGRAWKFRNQATLTLTKGGRKKNG